MSWEEGGADGQARGLSGSRFSRAEEDAVENLGGHLRIFWVSDEVLRAG